MRWILPLAALLAAAPALAQQAPSPPTPSPPTPSPPTPSPVAPAKPEQPAEPMVAILGEPVVGPDGKALGRLIDVIVDATGAPQAAAIDFGGFIGIGSRKIVVPWSALHFAPQAAKRPITLEMTPEQIKAAPEYKPTPAPPPAAAPAPPPAPAPTPPSQSP
jgi:hypothetical protein